MNSNIPDFEKFTNTIISISESFYPKDYNTRKYPPDAPKKPELNKRKNEINALKKEYEKLIKYKQKRNGGNNQTNIVYVTKKGISICNAVLPKELHVESIRKDGRGLISRLEMSKVLSLYNKKYEMMHKCDDNKSYIIPDLSLDKGLFFKNVDASTITIIKDGKEYKGLSWVKYFSLGTQLLDFSLTIPSIRLNSQVYEMQEKRLKFLNGEQNK